MPLQNTSGNDTTDAYGGGVASVINYIENVFSTYLYTGTGATQTINNGIDESGKGALTWLKSRNAGIYHNLFDTVRGAGNVLYSNATDPSYYTNGLSSFNSNGFTVSSSSDDNISGNTYVSWTFRKQPMFFDVVTYTGTGSAQAISHNLGSTPGCIIVKQIDNVSATNWFVYHRSANGGATPEQYGFLLNATAAQLGPTATYWNNTAPTSTQFSVGSGSGVNSSGGTYVAYLFAHNAGGFGLTGTDNVISCGSFTTDGSGNATINLGYEAQYILVKRTDSTGAWYVMDIMRGFSQTNDYLLSPNTSASESSYGAGYFTPTATGFSVNSYAPSYTFIYIAIRRGPMKVPTDATNVYTANPYTATNTDGLLITSGFPVDTAIIDPRNGYAPPGGPNWFSRLTGNGYFLQTPQNNSESNGNSNSNGIMGQDGITVSHTGTNVWSNVGSNTYVLWFLRRAPSFFDEVCYKGTGSATTQNHNLGVIPELIIIKNRDSSSNWPCYNSTLGATNYIYLNDSGAYGTTSVFWGNTTPTSSVFSLGSGNYNVNTASANYVAYLFATCAGVSKVGSYTGNGTTQAIACGFSGGARFVLIKRTDSTGDWYVYDTARGMTTSTDPYLLINTTSAETATLGSVTTTTGGFTVNASILAAINTSSATYIFLAIA